MSVTQETTLPGSEVETPFAEALPAAEGEPASLGFLSWTETVLPFAEGTAGGLEAEGETAEIVAEAFESLQDESFAEALAELISETSQAADQRIQGEQSMQLAEQRSRLADAHLAPIGFEAEQCVQRFIDHVPAPGSRRPLGAAARRNAGPLRPRSRHGDAGGGAVPGWPHQEG